MRNALNLFGQIFRDLFFKAAEQEGVEFPAEFKLRKLGIGSAILDGAFIVFAEGFMVSEIAGHEKIHDRPEVGDAVFNRGSGKHQFVMRLNLFYSDGVLGGAIFNVLSFVEYGDGKMVLEMLIEIAADERVGGDN